MPTTDSSIFHDSNLLSVHLPIKHQGRKGIYFISCQGTSNSNFKLYLPHKEKSTYFLPSQCCLNGCNRKKKKKKGNNLNAIHREYGQINYIRSINFFKNEVLYPIWNIREILSERHKWKKVCSATHLYVSVKKRSPTHIYFYTNKLFLSYHSRDELLPPSGESERLRKRQFQFIKLFVPLELCDGYLF